MFALQMAYSPEKFGPNVKAARDRLRLTQEQVAQRAGVAVRTYIQWEHGRAMPRGYNLDNLAKVLKSDPVDLLQGVSDVEPEQNVHDRLESIEAKLDFLIEKFASADELIDALNRRQSPPASQASPAGIAPHPKRKTASKRRTAQAPRAKAS